MSGSRALFQPQTSSPFILFSHIKLSLSTPSRLFPLTSKSGMRSHPSPSSRLKPPPLSPSKHTLHHEHHLHTLSTNPRHKLFLPIPAQERSRYTPVRRLDGVIVEEPQYIPLFNYAEIGMLATSPSFY
ncbi:hypothetical protein GQ43DRAFT_64989 [Delitschia confertaspora ATCC 74209]|uniref:Uncharacterized protein n=1 Tax=Delitschia confertaspora ATCC 74209 TaxID=1513339 RepID=A0A9P4JJN3_9PLEO|nr:hypothetical protein GQ43DRAFT_64989 [Delitschia confertaspora ATCC 74209]